MVVNLSQGQIKWICNENTIATKSTNFLKEENRKFIPFVETYHKDVKFQWLI